jgi:nucleotide-binding universal stress UspA family protein
MNKTAVLALDLSPAAEPLLECAAELRRWDVGRLVIIHVVRMGYRDRRIVLLRALEQSVGGGPDRDPLGNLLHVRRHHNLRPLGRGKPNRIEVSAGRSCR